MLMTRALLTFGIFSLLVFRTSAQTTSVVSVQFKAFGLSLGPVPEVLYSHLPSLRPGHGIIITSVVSESPAARAGLQRNDVLVSLGDAPIRGVEQFTRLLVSGVDEKTNLVVLRRGQPMTVQVPFEDGLTPKGAVKPGGPPAVSIHAKNLAGGKLSVTFTYFSKQSKLESVTCAGSLPEIKEQVRVYGAQNSMPASVQDLVDAGLERLGRRQSLLSSPGSSATGKNP
jgi:membrane-associated protease RseP (regulator of RpoE activity)